MRTWLVIGWLYEGGCNSQTAICVDVAMTVLVRVSATVAIRIVIGEICGTGAATE